MTIVYRAREDQGARRSRVVVEGEPLGTDVEAAGDRLLDRPCHSIHFDSEIAEMSRPAATSPAVDLSERADREFIGARVANPPDGLLVSSSLHKRHRLPYPVLQVRYECLAHRAFARFDETEIGPGRHRHQGCKERAH